jgi:hypothetical protein
MVESEKQFLSYLSNPLLIETMATYRFTSMNVIQYNIDLYCLIIGTSKDGRIQLRKLFSFIYLGNGRLLTAFTDRTFKTNIFEELTLPTDMHYPIKSITYKKMLGQINKLKDMYCAFFFSFRETNSYVIIVTNYRGYLVIKLSQCNDKLCFTCWTKDCLIRKISRDE